MTRKQARKHDRICLAIVLIIGAVLMVHTAVAAVRGASERKRQEEQRKQEIRERIENADSLADLSAGVVRALNGTMTGIETGEQATLDADIENIGAFDTMSMDYGGEEDGFVFYEIPEEYQATGGYFPEETQIYTYCLCKQYGVRYSLVVAMIERESGYQYDRIGDDGHSMGYMQIWQSAHIDRMEELGATNLLDPYQNIHVGIDYISGLIEKYGTIQDALAAYNYGERGAYTHLWSNGIYVYEYNETIIQRMKEIEEELEQ